jgi:MFS family permease
VVLWGLHMGFTQGILATLIADSAPPELRGTAFGMFNLVTGGALLAASVIAGVLWDAFGAQWTFLAGAVFAVVTIGGLIPLHGQRSAQGRASPPGTPVADDTPPTNT